MTKTFIKQNQNKALKMDGLFLLQNLPDNTIDGSFTDFQYRTVMDKMNYGNEGARQKKRALLDQMPVPVILNFLHEIARVLKPSAYLFLWVDKFIICEGNHLEWMKIINKDHNPNPKKITMNLVDMIVWQKGFGMGARSRRTNEFLLIYQKRPKTVKNWTDRGIPDTVQEKIPNPRSGHPHKKPKGLIERLMKATSKEKSLWLEPCAGSFSLFDVCRKTNRNFIGSDLTLKYVNVEGYEVV